MQSVDQLDALREQVQQWRDDKRSIAFVPTMGNLHQGHLSLVRRAQELADKVIVSVFVNPLQFDDKNDLSAYPRTLVADIEKLESVASDLVFTPTADTVYPNGMDEQTVITVPSMDNKLCGQARPGHFDGVATVVAKLFNMVQADFAVFGEKDYQQLLLIRKMVSDLNIPITIIAGETYREKNGLAMSSRNQYLNAKQRDIAAALYQNLLSIKNKLEQGDEDFLALEKYAVKSLHESGFVPDYVDIRRADDLERAEKGDKSLRILVAARLGNARLIDNIACNLA
ncbi:MAG: pantoate--beta-alanine ligase [Gammaproteobacteria bacterium]|nr:pantoate--beta-alanine ligase [Gammaproteobacteria bacterium]